MGKGKGASLFCVDCDAPYSGKLSELAEGEPICTSCGGYCQPEDWLPHELEEFVDDGLSHQLFETFNELKRIRAKVLRGEFSELEQLLKSLEDSKGSVAAEDWTERAEYFEEGRVQGVEKSIAVIRDFFRLAKSTDGDLENALANVMRELNSDDWDDDKPEPLYQQRHQEHQLAARKISKSEPLIAKYKDHRPANTPFWILQQEIQALVEKLPTEIGREDLCGKLLSRGLKNESDFIQLLTDKYSKLTPIEVLMELKRALAD